MLAIHNFILDALASKSVANAYAKLSKCQQFTTNGATNNSSSKLQTLMQSYQNVSNSQLILSNFYILCRCKRFCKVIKMLAIHNYSVFESKDDFVANAYAKLSKCQQFTTKHHNRKTPSSCKRLCKVIKMLAIHNLKSKLQLKKLVANAYAKLSKCQQFTTVQFSSNFCRSLQTLMQSYQNVSNSQLISFGVLQGKGCKRLCKVIKMLAIHNKNVKKLNKH